MKIQENLDLMICRPRRFNIMLEKVRENELNTVRTNEFYISGFGWEVHADLENDIPVIYKLKMISSSTIQGELIIF